MPTLVISGSFNKHFSDIIRTKEEFEKLGVHVLSPKGSVISNPRKEFLLLDTDEISDAKVVEQRHLESIKKADALFIYNKEGYAGSSVAMELGWALALGKPIYTLENFTDITLNYFGGRVATPQQILKELSSTH